jgi:hypothetical protein
MSNLPFAQPVAPTEFRPGTVIDVQAKEDDPNNIQTECDTCRQVDNHPKHQIATGAALAFGAKVYHPDDHNQDGVIQYHFDCDTAKDESGLNWHQKVHAAYHAELAALAASGVKGDALRAEIPNVYAKHFQASGEAS